jgi:hypothetical protein
MRESQNIMEMGRVILRWDVGEKIWGYKAMKFKDRIRIKIIKIILSLPFSAFFSLNKISFLNVDRILFFIFIAVEEFFHKRVGCIIVNNNKEIQDMFNIEVLGSKIENKFIIILLTFVFFLIL